MAAPASHAPAPSRDAANNTGTPRGDAEPRARGLPVLGRGQPREIRAAQRVADVEQAAQPEHAEAKTPTAPARRTNERQLGHDA